jgi:signal transduction histidine kinase
MNNIKLKRFPNFTLYISIFWLSMILMIGIWWYYLLVKMATSSELSLLKLEKFRYMLKWEGLTFLILFIVVSSYLIYFYLKDISKSKTIQNFFASVTHELKTPLASIRLQAEVLESLMDNTSEENPISSKVANNDTFKQYLERLLEDAQTLELELDKILQLARVQRGGVLNLTKLNLIDYLQNTISQVNRDSNSINFDLVFEDHKHSTFNVLVDRYALDIIIKNLIDNTTRYCNQDNKKTIIKINHNKNNFIQLSYKDNGDSFSGDKNKLGKIFYKSNSSKGSGIGLYLIKKLVISMKGKISFKPQEGFNTIILLKSSEKI